jgi:excisionase family DNA binding protein
MGPFNGDRLEMPSSRADRQGWGAQGLRGDALGQMAAVRVHVHDPLLSVEQAAEFLGVSAYTVRQWARERRIPAIRLGRYWRFRQSSLDAWIEAQERAGR